LLVDPPITQGVHKHVDTDDHLTEGRVSPSAVNGSKGGNSDSLGLNRPSRSDARPRHDSTLGRS